MAVNFQILPERGLVYVRYEGVATVADSAQAFEAYRAHPDFARGQKHLVDLSGVTAVDHDFPALFQLQMDKAEVFLNNSFQTLLVYFAPTDLAFELAQIIAMAWKDVRGPVLMVQRNEAEALALLGQPEASVAQLLKTRA